MKKPMTAADWKLATQMILWNVFSLPWTRTYDPLTSYLIGAIITAVLWYGLRWIGSRSK